MASCPVPCEHTYHQRIQKRSVPASGELWILRYYQFPSSVQPHMWNAYFHELKYGTKAYSSVAETLQLFRTTLLSLGNFDRHPRLPHDSRKVDDEPIHQRRILPL